MPIGDKQALKRTEEVLQAMNELTGWESGEKGKSMPLKEIKRYKK